MKPEERQDLVQYRLKLSLESVKEAERLLMDPPHPRGAVNRIYYAIFYAVQALAISRGKILSKHTHAISFFDKEFVKTGLFDKNMSKIVHNTFDLRLRCDYQDFIEISTEEARDFVEQAEFFSNAVKNYLGES